MNDYDPSPGVDVTAAGETLAGVPDAPPTDNRPVYFTGNIWMVAAAWAYGIDIIGYGRSPRTGRDEWLLDNTDSKAYQTAREFLVPDEMIAPVHAIQKGYRTACKVRDAARGIRHEWHGRQDNNNSNNNKAA